MKTLFTVLLVVSAAFQSVSAASVADITKLKDIPYGNDPRQTIDVYKKEGVTGAPVIFMVHGGAWRIGDKRMGPVIKNKVERWVPEGFIFIPINYRMLPEADPLVQLQDVVKALATAQEKAESWGGDPSKFIVMGHSAGAHLVGLLAASPSIALEAGAQKWLGTVLLDTAVLDVPKMMNTRHARFYDAAFGDDPEFWKGASPIQNLSAGAGPMYIVCSSRRRTSCSEADAFQKKAAALGVRASVLKQDMKHGEINGELGLPGAYTESVEAFMASLDERVNLLLMALKK